MSKFTIEVKYYVDIEANNAEEAEQRGYEIVLYTGDLFFVNADSNWVHPWASDVINANEILDEILEDTNKPLEQEE